MCSNPYWTASGVDALGTKFREWFYSSCTTVLCLSCSTYVNTASWSCNQLPCRLSQLFKFVQGNSTCLKIIFNLWWLFEATMVDKIPWDTCVIALIFGVFKMEFSKSTVICFKMCCLPPPPPPIQCWNFGELACTRVQHCRGGERGGGWTSVDEFVWCVCKSATNVNLSQDFCPWLSEFQLRNEMSFFSDFP